jgi:acetyl-CoA carboxylase biotin carboxyl carrier protein
MNPDEIQELKELIELLKENKIGEFELEQGELKVRIKFAQEAAAPAALVPAALISVPQVAPSATAPAASAPSDPASPAESLHTVKSPIVGTFYESPSPGSSAFVKIGDQVEVGQVLCIVEAMKLMNEIESDAAGEIVSRLVQNGQPIEYGQPLFAIRPR